MAEAEGYHIRKATTVDISILVLLRCEMFQAMGFSDASLLDQVAEVSTSYFKRTIPNSDFQVCDTGRERDLRGGRV